MGRTDFKRYLHLADAFYAVKTSRGVASRRWFIARLWRLLRHSFLPFLTQRSRTSFPPPPICVLVTSRHFVGVLETHGPKHIPQQGTGTDTENIEMLAYDVTAATMSARNIFRNSEN